MNKKKQEEFRKLLAERLDELLSEAYKTVSGMTDERESFPDPTDRVWPTQDTACPSFLKRAWR